MWSEADEQEAARSSSHWTSRIEKANAMSLMDSESVDHSANAIGKQLQKSVAKVHDVNHKARQAKRDAAAESAGSVVKVQIEQMKKEVAKQSQDAADKAAKATAAATAGAPKKAHVASTKVSMPSNQQHLTRAPTHRTKSNCSGKTTQYFQLQSPRLQCAHANSVIHSRLCS